MPHAPSAQPPTFLTLPQHIKSRIYRHFFSLAVSTYTFAPRNPPLLPLSIQSSSHISLLHTNRLTYHSAKTSYFKHATIRFRGFERFMALSLPNLPTLANNVVCLHLPVGFVNDMLLKGGFGVLRKLKRVVVEKGREWIDTEFEGRRPGEGEIRGRVLKKGGELEGLVELLGRVELMVVDTQRDEEEGGGGGGGGRRSDEVLEGHELSKAVPIKLEFNFVVKVTPIPVRTEEGHIEDIPGSVIAHLHYTLDLRTQGLFHEKTRLEWA